MGRPAKYSDEAILRAARDLIAEAGPSAATVTALAHRIGAPSGSLYHRFASRDLLMARLWISTVREFQRGFLHAFTGTDLRRTARQAMRHTVSWARDHPTDARILLLYRREQLIERWPDELGEDLRGLNQSVADAITGYTHSRYASTARELVEAVRFALVGIPYAAVRASLLRGRVPSRTDEELAVVAGEAILARLDHQDERPNHQDLLFEGTQQKTTTRGRSRSG